MGIPELIRDEQNRGLQGWRTQVWRINANVTGHLYLHDGDAMVDLQLRFAHDADALLWESKRVMPVMSQFGCTESGGLGWWGLRFSREQTSAIFTFLEKVTASREFYRW
jgi:hypothetical protein